MPDFLLGFPLGSLLDALRMDAANLGPGTSSHSEFLFPISPSLKRLLPARRGGEARSHVRDKCDVEVFPPKYDVNTLPFLRHRQSCVPLFMFP